MLPRCRIVAEIATPLPRSVASLRELKSLASLDLEGTDLTDVGIQYLSELPNLGLVRVGRTKVTSKAVAKLQKTLPQLTVRR